MPEKQPTADVIAGNDVCELRLDATSGDLKGVRWKERSVELIKVPALAENFRLLLPANADEVSYFSSREQDGAQISVDENAAVIRYQGLRNERESVDVNVSYRISFADGGIDISMTVENNTDRVLTELMYGILGGFSGFGRRRDMRSLVPGAHTNLAPDIFHTFPGGEYGGANLGIPYSACGFMYGGYEGMSMSWSSFYNIRTGDGLYYASHDPETRVTGLYMELRPCTSSAVTGSNWPEPRQLPSGEAVGLSFGWLNFPWSKGAIDQFGPVHLEMHDGDWRGGSDLYRAWYDTRFTIEEPTFLRKQMAWQSVILRNPEGVTNHRFEELPALARDAKKYGIESFEILGWDDGGIDRGYPNYVPESRLGDRETFREVLKEMREDGVNPVIFANLQVADTGTPGFAETYSDYAIKGLWADDLRLVGYGEGTISARYGHTRSNMAILSLAHPELRAHLTRQLVELVRAGASALQLDKTAHTENLDFNPKSPLPPDKSAPQGMLMAFDEVLAACRRVDPDFALASETWWDRTFPYVQVLYSRMGEIDIPSPALLYTFPEITSTIFAENPTDFDVMNNGMRYGMVWALAPRHYSDSVDEELTRPLARYVHELIRIRSLEESILFHGRYQGTDGAAVTRHRDIRYSVFRSRAAGEDQTACVVVNFGTRPVQVAVELEGAGQVVVYQPFRPDRIEKGVAHLELEPHTLGVVSHHHGRS